MAAKFQPENGAAGLIGAGRNAGSSSAFNGSLTHAQLAAEIGRCLQSQYQGALKEPVPDKLAALLRQLQEQDRAGAESGKPAAYDDGDDG